jgi:glycerophosphoryl diester phosphodiesterase
MTAPPGIVAHRGWATRHPENTLPALRGALDAGVLHVEFDVQLSADGVPLLIHDPTLERTAGRPDCVFDLTWTQLAGVSVRREEEDGAGVPLANLAQAAAMLTAYPDATAFVEIKRHSVERFGAARCVARCLAALGPVAPRSVVTSFEASVVEAARTQRAAAVAWVLREYDPPALETARRLAPDYLFCNHEKLPPDDSRLPSGPWAWVVYEVRTAALAHALGRRGVAFVETMAVGELLDELAGKGCSA